MNHSAFYIPNFNGLSKNNIALFVFWLFLLSGLIGIQFGNSDWFIEKTPLNLSVQTALVIWVFSFNKLKNLSLFFALVLLGLIAEIIGVNTSLLFGDYSYGQNLGPKVFGVPLLIGFNWAALSIVSASLAEKTKRNNWQKAIIGATLMLIIDFPLEIIANKFDFWTFPNGPGFFNYFSWGLLAFGMQFLVQKIDFKKQPQFSLHFYLGQLFFFSFFALA